MKIHAKHIFEHQKIISKPKQTEQQLLDFFYHVIKNNRRRKINQFIKTYEIESAIKNHIKKHVKLLSKGKKV